MLPENISQALKRLRISRMIGLAVVFCSLLTAVPGHAAVLDWDTATWADGSLSNSYDVDGDGSMDVTVSISGNTAPLQAEQTPGLWDANRAAAWEQANNQTGAPSSAGTGGKLLTFWMDQASKGNTITVKVVFTGDYASGVYTSFELHDIDQGNYQDQVTVIKGLKEGTDASRSKNWSVAPTSVTGAATSDVTGSNLNYAVTGYGSAGNNSANGDAEITFGTQKVSGFQFTYGNGSASADDPGRQHIQLGDISFSKTVTPEMHPGLAGAVLCAVALGAGLIQNIRSRRKALS